LLLIALVSAYPIAYAINVSLYETSFLDTVRFVGLENYVKLLQDGAIWESLRTSVLYTLGASALSLPLGLAFALLLNRRLVLGGVIRGVMVAPWAVSQTVAALLWLWLLEPSWGPVNYTLASLGQEKIFFLADPKLAMVTIIGATVWFTYPYPMIIFMAGLKTIPRELYEAARVDGCGPWRAFRHMTLPLLRPTILTTAILVSLLYVNIVTLIYVMTGGGPLNATETVSIAIFRDSFINFQIGFAAALSFVMFLLNIVFVSAYMFLLRSNDKISH
jgi:multiple sugar transport system permease protein